MLSLHIGQDQPHAEAFPDVSAGVQTGLSEGATYLADDAGRRLVVLLPGSGPGAARGLLSHIKQHLYEQGHDGSAVLEAFSALVIPNGRPFQDPKALMDYAMGEG